MGPLRILSSTSPDATRLAAGASANSTKNDPAKIADAARQFEALMIGEILKAAHGSGSDGWLGAGDDDESSSTAIQMAQEYLGQAIANGGGLGIAKLVVKGVDRSSATTASSSPEQANSGTIRMDSVPPSR